MPPRVTAAVTATPPAMGPTRRVVATADPRLTARRPVPASTDKEAVSSATPVLAAFWPHHRGSTAWG